MSEIRVTDSAAAHLQKSLQGQNDALGVRVGVKSSGCSGLSYYLELAKAIHPQDVVYQVNGLQLVVDSAGLRHLKGMEIDCIREGLNEYLKFNNPNVKGTCGCGESFSVEE